MSKSHYNNEGQPNPGAKQAMPYNPAALAPSHRRRYTIKYDVFEGNSSSAEALADFGEGASLPEALKGMWCPDAKRELKEACKKIGVKRTRSRALRYSRKMGRSDGIKCPRCGHYS